MTAKKPAAAPEAKRITKAAAAEETVKKAPKAASTPDAAADKPKRGRKPKVAAEAPKAKTAAAEDDVDLADIDTDVEGEIEAESV